MHARVLLCDNIKSERKIRTPAIFDDCRRMGDIAMLDNLFTPTHLIIILVIALLVFGPRKLPELGKGLGEGLRGFKEGIKGATDTPKQDTTIAKADTPQPPAATQIK
jgi:sec-independent protein translocase protein TatA